MKSRRMDPTTASPSPERQSAWPRRAGGACALLVLLWASSGHAAGARIVVQSVGQEDPTLGLWRTSLVAGGMSQTTVDQVLKGFDRYVDERVRAGKRVVLFPEATLLLTRSAARQGWSGEEICAFLVYIQSALDDDNESASLLTQHAVNAIRASKNAQTAVVQLKGQEGVRRSLR
jgi:hypothetical protein